jgi:hypothetical protein
LNGEIGINSSHIMNKKMYIIGTILLIVLTNLLSIDIAHGIGYDLGKEEQKAYIRKLEIKNEKMEKISRQVLSETIVAFRDEANKQLNYGNYNAFMKWHESAKLYQMALDSIESYSLLGDIRQ